MKWYTFQGHCLTFICVMLSCVTDTFFVIMSYEHLGDIVSRALFLLHAPWNTISLPVFCCLVKRVIIVLRLTHLATVAGGQTRTCSVSSTALFTSLLPSVVVDMP